MAEHMHLPRGVLLAALSISISFAQTKEDTAFFESSVRPILASSCTGCHNARTRTSGLSLESREALLEGGNRGPAAMPGKPGESLLLKAVHQSGDLKMPPAGKLKDEQIAALSKWIEAGLPWPAEKAKIAEQSQSGHWAFQPPKRHPAPAVKDAAWPRNAIDNFILAKLEANSLAPSPEADQATLLRRVSLDLTGLPPSPKEVEEFLADKSPEAYERAVDRLLASPHYGERWGRHWLDVARYADSNGYNIDGPRDIWKYRDWVIEALNRDLPFDQFVVEQLAGDLLPKPSVDQLIATGFHRNTPLNLEGGIDFEQYRVEAVVDRVATTGAAFLGLTLGCARCHDHKYDPVSQREFYRIYAFFNNIDEMTNDRDRTEAHEPVLELPAPEEQARHGAWESQVSVLNKELAGYVRSLAKKQGKVAKQEDPGLLERVANVRTVRRREPKITSTLVMRELPQPREAYIQLGGDFLRKGVIVTPGVLAVLPPLAATPNPTRLDFARWLMDPANPLTSRVTVNRMWQAYFGKGLVETENDFGTQGSPPTHPELLDWLATEFIQRGWSQKAIHRTIVTSATYRQSSRHRPEVEAVDPGNRLLARQSRLRLEAEIVRDAALVSSGLFTPAVGGPSVFPPIPAGAMAVTQINREWPTETGPNRYRRGLYTFFWRSAPHPGLMVFDAPDSTATCTRRPRSNTPLQALTLLNDEAFVEFAQALGERIVKEAPDDAARMRHAFLLALSRPPTPVERPRMERFLALQLDEFKSSPEAARQVVRDPERDKKEIPVLAAWTSVARVLLNLDDFLTRD
ncbi:MAG: PSD1 and planctomycete cytochrome C domain-containing protein [Bryobacteraceae bacterium]